MSLDRRVRLAVLSGAPTDGTSWYRAVYPFQQLSKQYPVDIQIIDKTSWADLSGLDIVFMHRPDCEAAHDIVTICNTLGIPVWADYDDCIMSIPNRNPFYETIHTGRLTSNLISILSKVAVVTTSTPTVKDHFKVMNPNVIVLPNAYHQSFYKNFKPLVRQDDRVRILWRGSDSQAMNLRALSPIIKRTISQYDNVDWVIHAGHAPYHLIESVPPSRIKFVPWKTIPDVFVSLIESAPDIAVVCLFDDVFDKGRSPTVAFETRLTNTALVCPYWYDLPGVATYTPGNLIEQPLIGYTEDELRYAVGDLEKVLTTTIEKSKEERNALAQETSSFVQDNCNLDKINKKRWSIIETLITTQTPTIKLQALETI